MIFLAGHHNSGKSTLAGWFESGGFKHIETGDIIRNCYKSQNITEPFGEWASRVNAETPDYFNEIILEHIRKVSDSFSDLDKVIITGNRQLGGINYLTEHIQGNGHKPVIVFLEASEQELYRRQLERSDRIIPNLTFDKFSNEYLAYDKNMGIDNIKKRADYVIDSNKPVEEILREIVFILGKTGYPIESISEFSRRDLIENSEFKVT